MKLAFHFITIILVSTITLAQGSDAKDVLPNFRGTEWGTSYANVEAKELAEYHQDFIGFGMTILSYKGKLLNYEAGIDYVFESDTLTEAMYILEVESFPEIYQKIKEHYFSKYDEPHYWANAHPHAVFNWGEEENGVCKGPEIYWEFCDGFIGIISEKDNDEISITVLYAYNKTILDYGKYVKFPL